MKPLIIFLLLSTSTAWADDHVTRSRREERKKARIERRIQRALNPWDERAAKQKKHDRNALLFLALGAGLAVRVIVGE